MVLKPYKYWDDLPINSLAGFLPKPAEALGRPSRPATCKNGKKMHRLIRENPKHQGQQIMKHHQKTSKIIIIKYGGQFWYQFVPFQGGGYPLVNQNNNGISPCSFGRSSTHSGSPPFPANELLLYQSVIKTSWWLSFNPAEKICSSNWIISPGENKQCFKPPARKASKS